MGFDVLKAMSDILDRGYWGLLREEPDMSASYGYEIVVVEKKDEDGKVVRKAKQLFEKQSGLMDEPKRGAVLFEHHELLVASGIKPEDVDDGVKVYVTRPFISK